MEQSTQDLRAAASGHRRHVRIVALGDELLSGVGDPRALGWFGRVISKTPIEGITLEHYALAMPGEGTEALSERWQDEAVARFSAVTADGGTPERHLVVALNDTDLYSATSSARSRLNLANILDRASQEGIRCLVLARSRPWTPSATSGSPSSTPPTGTWPRAGPMSMWTPMPRWSAMSSGAVTSRRTADSPARPATACSPGWCCTAAGIRG